MPDPTVTGFSSATGSAPDWWKVHADGGFTCINDLEATITTTGGGSTVCYQLRVITDKTSSSAMVSGSDSASLTINDSAYSGDTDIYFVIEKTCSPSVRERVSYTVDYHL